MSISPSYPFTLQNGTTADATQVMADFNQIQSDVNTNAAHNGANSDITSLTGLTTPLSIAQGGTAAITAAAARTSLGVPGLTTNNTYTGTQTFSNTVTMSAAAFNEATQVTIASAASVAIGTAASNNIIISGVTTITSFGNVAAGINRFVTFSGILTLTHNATSLILPGAVNITTAVGDTALMQSLGAGNWRCMFYALSTGLPVTSPGSSGRLLATQYFTVNGTYTPNANMAFCVVRAVGGGGGGGGGFVGGTGTGAGGGAAGATVFARFTAATIGASQAVTIGTGGAGGGASSNGSAGTATTLGAILSAGGGGEGQSSINMSAGGIGASASSGADTTFTGGDGCLGMANGATSIPGGNGGASYFGGGGRAGYSTGGGMTGAQAGKGYGSGGGGGGANGGAGAGGGAGAAGYMLIEEYS